MFEPALISSSIPGVDRMFGGGLDRGTCTSISGNSGVGKSCLGVAMLVAAAARGERSVLFSFDEWPTEAAHRSEAIGLDIRGPIKRGLIHVRKVNPLGLAPEQFCNWVRVEVEQKGTRMVMIDTINGYEMCTRDKVIFISHLQQFVGYLKSRGVTLFLVNEIPKLTGDLTMAESGLSFIVDNTVLIKAFEDGGALRKAIAVTRRRLGPHDDRFYEFRVTPRGLHIGAPLDQLKGILGGEPHQAVASEGSPYQNPKGRAVLESGARPLVLLHLGWSRDRELVGSLPDATCADSLSTPAAPELGRLLGENRLDLILADTKGGRGTLDDLLRLLDSVLEACELPMVLLAEADEIAGLATLVLERPNAVLLAKPVDPGQLRATIEAGLRYRAGRRRERELVRRVTDANAELKSADRKKDEFLAMLAHELRNPLSAIGNASQVSRRGQAEEHRRWSREVIEKHVGSPTRMIDDLLDVSRITRGKIELKKRTNDVLAVIRQAVETVRPLVRERDHD